MLPDFIHFGHLLFTFFMVFFKFSSLFSKNWINKMLSLISYLGAFHLHTKSLLESNNQLVAVLHFSLYLVFGLLFADSLDIFLRDTKQCQISRSTECSKSGTKLGLRQFSNWKPIAFFSSHHCKQLGPILHFIMGQIGNFAESQECPIARKGCSSLGTFCTPVIPNLLLC